MVAKSKSTLAVMTPGFRLNPKQVEANRLLGNSQRHTLLVGGSRSGKTFLLIRALVTRAIRAPGTRHAILRFRQNAVRASVALDTFPKVMRTCFPQVPYVERRQDGFFELPNSSQIWLSGLDENERVEKILGQEYLTMLFNECSQIPYSSVAIALTRLAQTYEGMAQKAYYDLNPTGKSHWTYLQFDQGRDPTSRRPLRRPEDYKRIFMNPVDNKENLTREYIESLQDLPEKQRRRFYEGQYVDEIEGALWTYSGLEKCRYEEVVVDEGNYEQVLQRLIPTLVRVEIGVDPSGASGKEDKRSDEIGIVAAGVDARGTGYVLADGSLREGPSEWGRAVVRMYEKMKADRVVAETNFGGEMVRFVIKSLNPAVKVRIVTASRGKTQRAEPVSALYDSGKVFHLGRFSDLEDQMCDFSSAGFQGGRSPDRADALIWVLSSLMLVNPNDSSIGAPIQAGAGARERA